MMKKIIVVTSGEPAGIGPDICLDLVDISSPSHIIVVIADYNLLRARATLLNKRVLLHRLDSVDEVQRLRDNRRLEADNMPGLYVLHVECAYLDCLGVPNVANVPYVLNMLQLAVDMCKSGVGSCIVTAPVHKQIINQAGINFTGHTEYLAQAFANVPVVMMLANAKMKVALLTTHIPLNEVASNITQQKLRQTLNIILTDFKEKYATASPKIAVCGLNPHAGEGGYLGREEQEIINPLIADYAQQGIEVSGAYAADTIFNRAAEFDVILAMYHDQGLPVLKYSGFADGINITLGLPIIRVSVDHGTALDLAGKNIATSSSLICAVRHVLDLCNKEVISK